LKQREVVMPNITSVDEQHGIVVRTWREPDGRWFATAEAIDAGLARATVAGGELPGTPDARARQATKTWPAESAMADSEASAVLEAVRRLLDRGLGPTDRASASPG
jgi:hypothetical protein